MKKITPWNKEVEKIFDSIVKHGRAYTDDITITRSLGKKLPDLFDDTEGFMDIGRIDKRKESIIVPRIGIHIIPLNEPTSRINERRRKKYGIYRV